MGGPDCRDTIYAETIQYWNAKKQGKGRESILKVAIPWPWLQPPPPCWPPAPVTLPRRPRPWWESHADVNAARTSKGGRSAPALDAAWTHARHTLHASVKRFVARNPRPEALEHRPIGRADDPRWSNPYFHAWQQHWTPCVEVAEASGRWRKPKTGASSQVSLTGQDVRKAALS